VLGVKNTSAEKRAKKPTSPLTDSTASSADVLSQDSRSPSPQSAFFLDQLQAPGLRFGEVFALHELLDPEPLPEPVLNGCVVIDGAKPVLDGSVFEDPDVEMGLFTKP